MARFFFVGVIFLVIGLYTGCNVMSMQLLGKEGEARITGYRKGDDPDSPFQYVKYRWEDSAGKTCDGYCEVPLDYREPVGARIAILYREGKTMPGQKSVTPSRVKEGHSTYHWLFIGTGMVILTIAGGIGWHEANKQSSF